MCRSVPQIVTASTRTIASVSASDLRARHLIPRLLTRSVIDHRAHAQPPSTSTIRANRRRTVFFAPRGELGPKGPGLETRVLKPKIGCRGRFSGSSGLQLLLLASTRDRCPPGQALPDRQPEYVASWIYVFGVLTLAALIVVIASRAAARHGRRRVVAHLEPRPLRQQPPPVERRAVLRLHGRAPLGQVLDGRLARPAGDDLDHRCRVVPCLHRHRVHRLPGADQLRLAVDLLRGQGRPQLRSASVPGSTSSTSARCCCGTSCCCHSWSASSPCCTSSWCGATASSLPSMDRDAREGAER